MVKSSPTPLFNDLQKFKETLDKRQKYVKEEFQSFGLELAKEMKDWKNRSLYIKMAKQLPRAWLEQARYFVKDQTVGKIKSRAGLFMWKIKQIKTEKK